MYTTIDDVAKHTGYTVTLAQITRAQTIIEAFTGRVEAEVQDANDLGLLGRATAFQAVYMQENPKLVYEQVAMKSTMQNDNAAVFDTSLAAPFLAPLAAMTVRRLSWYKSRSVRVGPMTPGPVTLGWDRE